jgi:hypothetical protein
MKDFVKHVARSMDGQRGYVDPDSDTDEEEDGWITPYVESVVSGERVSFQTPLKGLILGTLYLYLDAHYTHMHDMWK